MMMMMMPPMAARSALRVPPCLKKLCSESLLTQHHSGTVLRMTSMASSISCLRLILRCVLSSSSTKAFFSMTVRFLRVRMLRIMEKVSGAARSDLRIRCWSTNVELDSRRERDSRERTCFGNRRRNKKAGGG